MSAAALDALRRERERALALGRSLTPAEWAAPSDCDGWRVQDVFAHMAAVFKGIASPGSVASVPDSDDAEVQAEAGVGERKGWSPEQVLAEYEEWSTVGIEQALAALQVEPMASTVIPLGNLGSHPMHVLANALVFDHYCHLRHDILAPHGPVVRDPLPQEDATLAAILEWMLGGLPQMCATGLAVVDRPVGLVFEGPGAATWRLDPPAAPGGLTSLAASGVDGCAALATTTAHDFVCWGTRRRDWRAMGVRVDGDVGYGAKVLDVCNVI